MSGVKACKDCKHAVCYGVHTNRADPEKWRCTAVSLTNEVTGVVRWRQCTAARQIECGADAKLFEPGTHEHMVSINATITKMRRVNAAQWAGYQVRAAKATAAGIERFGDGWPSLYKQCDWDNVDAFAKELGVQ